MSRSTRRRPSLRASHHSAPPRGGLGPSTAPSQWKKPDQRQPRGRREAPMRNEQIRAIVGEHGRWAIAVSQLNDDASLYQAGLTSHASVNLMLAIEEAFGIEFPERMLRRRTFESIASIDAAVRELTQLDFAA